ncbi:MAG TPA: DegV family protein [bacterium (Candidatus Stahlbacteria)]|nr:DegV family protein [Candidatus Stahlbacteria bacterium]
MTRSVKIVTDSTADLPLSYYKKYDIEVVPLYIRFGTDIYKENVELSNEDFYCKLNEYEKKGIPTTSQPSPQDFIDAYNKIKEDSIISIHIGSKLSGTCQSANIAKGMLSDRDITVVDTGIVSAGLGMLVMTAAKAAKLGWNKEKILDLIDNIRQQLRIYFTVETLKYLEKNGRIGRAQALLGTILHIIPILSFEEGVIVPVEKVRGSKRVLPKYKELISKTISPEEPIDALLVQANCMDKAKKLEEMMRANFNCKELTICNVGGVVGSHAGPGTWGIAVCPSKLTAVK